MADAVDDHFGGKVVRCAAKCFQLSVDRQLREAHVGDLDQRLVVVRVEEDVLGLQVAVNNLLGVQILDGRKELVEQQLGLVLGHGAGVDDLLEELATVGEFKDDEQGVDSVDGVLHANDARVVDGLHDLDLVLETHCDAGGLHLSLVNRLDGKALAIGFAKGKTNHSAGTISKLL